jgi:hypothetical protein
MADQQALHAFAQWVAGCSGNEKQEAQTFVQKLLSAWGWGEGQKPGGPGHRSAAAAAKRGCSFHQSVFFGRWNV